MNLLNLKKLREGLGLTQKQFANELGVSYTTYNGYETGFREPKSDFWEAVADKYDVTLDYLFGFSNDPKGYRSAKKSTPAEAGADEPIPIGIFAEKNGEDYVKDTLLALGFIGDGQTLTKSQIRIAAYALEILATALGSDFQEEEDVG